MERSVQGIVSSLRNSTSFFWEVPSPSVAAPVITKISEISCLHSLSGLPNVLILFGWLTSNLSCVLFECDLR